MSAALLPSPRRTIYRGLKIDLALQPIMLADGSTAEQEVVVYLCEELESGPTAHDQDERLETVIVDWNEALAMALDGRLEDAKSILALLLCDRLRKPG